MNNIRSYYLNTAIKLLKKNAWKKNHTLTYEIYKCMVECLFFNSDYLTFDNKNIPLCM